MTTSIIPAAASFETPQYVGAPHTSAAVKDRYVSLMQDVFDRRYFTNNGPLVRELEEAIAQRHGVDHCVCACNGTVALILVLKALGLQGEVILPSFTFVATAHACLWQNLRVRFADISPHDLMISPDHVEKLVGPDTCAVIGVHLFGNVCDVRRLSGICDAHDASFILDAAHAFDCKVDGVPIGRHGQAEVLSLHATKYFSTFEGGAVLTDDGDLARRLRYYRNFGFETYDTVSCLGINGKMSEACAAMGLASLPELDARRERLVRTRELYAETLSRVPGVRLIPISERCDSNCHYVVVLLEDEFGRSADAVTEYMWRHNACVRRYFHPGCHSMEPYRTMEPDAGRELPVTEDVCRRVLCLPTNLADPAADVAGMAALLQQARALNTQCH